MMKLSDIALVVVLWLTLSAVVWYLKVSIPKWIDAANSKQLELFKTSLNRELEVLKSFLGGINTRNKILANRIVSLYDEVLSIIGDIKTMGYAQEIGYISTIEPNQLIEKMYKLELFAQTWWPYFGKDFRDTVLAFRQKVAESMSYDPEKDMTLIQVSHFVESAENLQAIVRRDLDSLFGLLCRSVRPPDATDLPLQTEDLLGRNTPKG